MAALATPLFVDDQTGLLRKIKRYFDRIGTQGFFADSILDARRLLDQEEIGHVISDWRIPGDGIQFLQQVRRDRPELKCTLFTGFSRELSQEDKTNLSNSRIGILDKSTVMDLKGRSLIDLVEDPTRFLSNSDGSPLEFATSAIPDEGYSSTEIAEDQLPTSVNIEQAIAHRDQVIQLLSQDLVDDLQELSAAGTVDSFSGALGKPEDIINEIKNLTPLGIRYIELDRRARHRQRQAAKSGLGHRILKFFSAPFS